LTNTVPLYIDTACAVHIKDKDHFRAKDKLHFMDPKPADIILNIHDLISKIMVFIINYWILTIV